MGPLAALSFVSLTLGHELREYQNRVEKWQSDQADWYEQRRLEAEAYERQQEAERQLYLQRVQAAEMERQEREAERRYEAERAEREWQHKQQVLTQRRLERKAEADRPAEGTPKETPPLERSKELDTLLAIVHERSAGQVYSPADVREWTGRGRTKTFELLRYGEQSGNVRRIKRGQYIYHNGTS